MKKTTLSLIGFVAIAVLALTMFSCEDDPEPVDPPTVQVFSSVDGYQVAFTATATNTDTYAWDFDDGESSTEQNPVHIYAQSGTYTATVTVTGEGGTANASETVTIAASELEMLTGGPDMPNGKTWVFSSIASENDGIYKATADFEYEGPIPDGMLGLIGLLFEYEDEFIFKHDMSYSHDVKNDSAVVGQIYTIYNAIPFRPSLEDGVGLAPFTPEAATFKFTENTDLSLTVVNHDNEDETLDLTWSDVTVLEIEGGTEFFGFWDATREYIVFNITSDKIELGTFTSFEVHNDLPLQEPSHLLRMTFVPKQ